MIHPDKWETTAFSHEYPYMIIAWNHLEQAAQRILLARLGGSNEAWMVVAEMGHRALPNAIKATSKTLDSDELVAHISYFLKAFEFLLDAVMGRRFKSSQVGWLSLRMMVLKTSPSDRPQAS